MSDSLDEQSYKAQWNCWVCNATVPANVIHRCAARKAMSERKFGLGVPFQPQPQADVYRELAEARAACSDLERELERHATDRVNQRKELTEARAALEQEKAQFARAIETLVMLVDAVIATHERGKGTYELELAAACGFLSEPEPQSAAEWLTQNFAKRAAFDNVQAHSARLAYALQSISNDRPEYHEILCSHSIRLQKCASEALASTASTAEWLREVKRSASFDAWEKGREAGSRHMVSRYSDYEEPYPENPYAAGEPGLK